MDSVEMVQEVLCHHISLHPREHPGILKVIAKHLSILATESGGTAIAALFRSDTEYGGERPPLKMVLQKIVKTFTRSHLRPMPIFDGALCQWFFASFQRSRP
jgi:hypothetical protein